MPGGLLDVTPALAPERAALLELLRGLSAEDWERPTECPEWTVKGLVLHILGDDLSLLSRRARRVARRPDALRDRPSRRDVPGAARRVQRAVGRPRRRFLSVELVLELLRLVGEWSDTFYREVGLETRRREAVGLLRESRALALLAGDGARVHRAVRPPVAGSARGRRAGARR